MKGENIMQRKDLFDLAEAIVAESKGRAVIAFQEDDQSKKKVEDAAHFIKVDGKRVGRDIELYGFMGDSLMGWKALLPDLISEVLMPIKAMGLTKCYKVGAEKLKTMGHEVYSADMHAEWDALF